MTTAIFVLLCIAMLADGYTTVRAAKLPGAYEANKLLAKLFGKKPREALLVLKVGLVAWIGYEINKMNWQADNDYVSAMVVLTLAMSYAAHNNWQIIKRLEK